MPLNALIHYLCITASLGIKCLLAYDDSKVGINQVNKEWITSKKR